MKWSKDETLTAVESRYGQIARTVQDEHRAEPALDPDECRRASLHMGYSADDLDDDPGGNLGLGCGNPLAIDGLGTGDTVVDLGSGAGFDAFIAARKVGSTGTVIGIDMSEDMIALARRNAEKAGLAQVTFRRAQIEDLPIAEGTVDAVISNCVINLSPDKGRVFAEAWRVLRPGGWLSVTDVLLNAPLPAALLDDLSTYAGCISGAEQKNDYLEHLRRAGFADIRVLRENDVLSIVPDELLAKLIARIGLPPETLTSLRESEIVSAHIQAIKQ